jgi:hypothetical protein
MIPRQESALDRALDRKLRILLSRRNELPTGNLRAVTSRRDEDTDLENLHEILGLTFRPGDAGAAGNVVTLFLTVQCANVIENKGGLRKTLP